MTLFPTILFSNSCRAAYGPAPQFSVCTGQHLRCVWYFWTLENPQIDPQVLIVNGRSKCFYTYYNCGRATRGCSHQKNNNVSHLKCPRMFVFFFFPWDLLRLCKQRLVLSQLRWWEKHNLVISLQNPSGGGLSGWLGRRRAELRGRTLLLAC